VVAGERTHVGDDLAIEWFQGDRGPLPFLRGGVFSGLGILRLGFTLGSQVAQQAAAEEGLLE